MESMDTVQVDRDFGWLQNAKGKFQRLVGMNAPDFVLRNEREMWDRKVANVRDALSTGKVTLDSEGWDVWRGILAEYMSMPSLEEALDAVAGSETFDLEEVVDALKGQK